MKNEKIIFLDIDGCICPLTENYYTKNENGSIIYNWSKEACEIIKKFCDKFNYKLVISSDWKEEADIIFKYLEKWELKKYLHKNWKTDSIDFDRFNQIHRWIKAHNEVLDNFIIIDDMAIFTGIEKQHLVSPSCFVGLQFEHWFLMEKIEKKQEV